MKEGGGEPPAHRTTGDRPCGRRLGSRTGRRPTTGDCPRGRRRRSRSAKAVGLRVADDSEEELACATVHLREGGVAYATVKGRFDARFSSAAFGALQARIEQQGELVVLDAAGGPYPLG